MPQILDLPESDPRCLADRCRQHPRAHEAVTNRAVALASTISPTLSAALISAIWGPDVALAHHACGAVIRESGRDADWLLTCGCSPSPVAVAEHKPTLRPVPNDTPCFVSHYQAAVDAGFITEPVSGYPTGAHEQPHVRREDCVFCMEREGVNRLVLPQVVIYALRYPHVPRVLVTDFPSADVAWARWGWDKEFQMSEEMMPIRRVPDVIDRLALIVRGDQVRAHEQSVLQVIACRLWWRTPWDAWEDGRATNAARDFVRDAEDCWREHSQAERIRTG